MLRHRSSYGKNDYKKKLKKIIYYEKLVATSLNYQTGQFFENSTLHGVRYIAEKGRPFHEKFMWFCCVTIGAIVTLIIIVSLWEKFQTNPTITGLDTDFHSWDVPFPALTLCEINPSNETYIDDYINRKWSNDDDTESRKEFLFSLTEIRLKHANIEDFTKFLQDGKVSTIDDNIHSILYEIVSHCEDIFEDCSWKGESFDCCSGFFPIFTEIGYCYTFNSRHYEKKWPWLKQELPEFKLKYIQETDNKWSFSFRSVSPRMLVYIHDSDEVPSIDTNPQHVWDQKVNKISFSMKQTYTTADAKQLSIKQRHCIFEDELKLKIDKMKYTYTACTRECRMESSKKLCGCVPFFYPDIEGFKQCKMNDLKCVFEHFNEITNVEHCTCELGCSNTVYEVEKLNEKPESAEPSLEVEFVSWPMVRYKREVLFGWVDLLVSFGGIAGLFLGFSLLSGVEIIYYFTIRALCMVYKEKEEVEKIRIENSMKKTKNYDLSLTPYFKRQPDPNNAIQEVMKNQNIPVFLPSNKIEPVLPKKIKKVSRNDIFYPPFGIEYLN